MTCIAVTFLILCVTLLSEEPQAKQFILRHLNITGNTRTDEQVIRRMIPLNEGDIFDQIKWEQGLDQINRSGLFEPLSPQDIVLTLDEAKGFVDVELRVRERDHQRIDVSAGGGSTGGASIGLDYSNINLTGNGDRLLARLSLGNRERNLGAAYSTLLGARAPVSFDLSGFYRRIEFVTGQGRDPLLVERTAGINLGISFSLTRSRYTFSSPIRAGISYSFTSTNLADTLSTGVLTSDLEQSGLRLASLTPTITYDTLDRDLDPQRGQHFVASLELGARAFGGSLNTIRPYLDYRRFFPLGKVQPDEVRAIGLRVRASHISGLGAPFRPQALSSVGGVPIFRRFFLGGETEVRGYDVNSIAPLARLDRFLVIDGQEPTLISSEVRPIGGDTELLLNAEYRVPIVWRFSAAAFFDIGTSFNADRLKEERIESDVRIEPQGTPATILSVLRPLEGRDKRLPSYRISLGGELRLPIPLLNIPLRLIFAVNPNAQTPLNSALIAPEKRFAFRFGFSRTL